MSIILGALGLLVRSTVIAGCTIIIAACMTKPDIEILKKDIETRCTSSATNDNSVQKIINTVLYKYTSNTIFNVKDFVVLKIVKVTFSDNTHETYVGIFQNWIQH